VRRELVGVVPNPALVGWIRRYHQQDGEFLALVLRPSRVERAPGEPLFDWRAPDISNLSRDRPTKRRQAEL